MIGSWKTTVSAAVAAFFGFVLFSPDTFGNLPWLQDLAKFAFLGGLASLGIHSQDVPTKGGGKQ